MISASVKIILSLSCLFFFFFNDTATTEIYTLSLHDALPISGKEGNAGKIGYQTFTPDALDIVGAGTAGTNRKIKLWAEGRSEEHTSELQSPCNLVCRLLLEKKKKKQQTNSIHKHYSSKSMRT